MKQKKYLFQVFVFVIHTFLVFPQQDEPIEISPYIGEKLDRVERDYFNLFPKIDGFQEAVFYHNPDSTLKVDIAYDNDGERRDTVLNRYRNLWQIQKGHNRQSVSGFSNWVNFSPILCLYCLNKAIK